ncbi:uncharacterized protein DUF3592 [Acetivibrio thermocellus AD2]|jgi:hypothetical protein|uniref:Uncharacterized protein DUF3592 n=1 Tax=Acetivibrio thermocellus AD2 TaxID=1138384 RepID=A0AB36TCX1_ACETH|nr:DUF3592 domain-containing protein [Acetivibrio thermocellus]CDG37364.1 hypothetical protein CTHBC1_2786 [Acetivibrio thermocellus BC1]ADU73503.1 Protein of unknown function DUF3592 [Acetivibrio thermocellus DSM 1313]ALX07425.1 Protein of unknown function DUF3592 [Acetivibrio thermocellus AD2]ANV75164.1 Protein of unknown function DUF3592 [Acetivibrio thermocellus DSM 2360]EIC04108.1 hypothetical protein YSBL_1982 [Acetivibrio thermocellus YS]
MKKNVVLILGIVFTAAGLIPILIGVTFFLSHYNFISNAARTTAVVTDIKSYRDFDGDKHYEVVIKYSVEGEEYYEIIAHSPLMYVGREITVYYDPNKPRHVKTMGFVFDDLFLVGIGLVFFIIGISFTASQFKKFRLRKRLLETGRTVYADISEITLNTSYTVNSKHPYVITCKWKDPDTGLFYFFTSDNIWFDPEPIIHEKGITSLPVYIDPENPKNYFVSVKDIEMFVANV